MDYNWNWAVLLQEPYAEWLLSGVYWTFAVALAAWVIAFTVGSLIGVARTVPNRFARAVGGAYVELFRNVPLLVQMFLWYFVLPEVVPEALGHWMKRDMSNPQYISARSSKGTSLFLMSIQRLSRSVRRGTCRTRNKPRPACASASTRPRAWRSRCGRESSLCRRG